MRDFEGIREYQNILCSEVPRFLLKYLSLPVLVRLKGVGLLCGTDWTQLYNNRFFYSRYDHSLGTALVTWRFTHSKKQTVASLLHDVSTPVFSHVSDFRRGDTMRQESSEKRNAQMILNDAVLFGLLKEDRLCPSDVCDYHKFPVCDNEIPRLSADRFEYMFPSGMALRLNGEKDDGALWNLEEIRRICENLSVMKNEDGKDELAFSDVQIASDYCVKTCLVGKMLQRGENKIALSLLSAVMNRAIETGILCEEECYSLSEQNVISRFEKSTNEKSERRDEQFAVLFKTFEEMTEIERGETKKEGAFCVEVNVKRRYINPLVRTGGKVMRVSEVSEEAKDAIRKFLLFNDARFACVNLARI